jgi:hypothetical protein
VRTVFPTPRLVWITRRTTNDITECTVMKRLQEFDELHNSHTSERNGKLEFRLTISPMTNQLLLFLFARTTLVQLVATVLRQLLHLVELSLPGLTLLVLNPPPISSTSWNQYSLLLRASQVISALTRLALYSRLSWPIQTGGIGWTLQDLLWTPTTTGITR